MQDRLIISTSDTGSISRLEAREAAKAVKIAKTKNSEKLKKPSPAARRSLSAAAKRYLGHFGIGSSTTQPKKAAAKSSAGTAPQKKPATT
jgi:hypothetical protein